VSPFGKSKKKKKKKKKVKKKGTKQRKKDLFQKKKHLGGRLHQTENQLEGLAHWLGPPFPPLPLNNRGTTGMKT